MITARVRVTGGVRDTGKGRVIARVRVTGRVRPG